MKRTANNYFWKQHKQHTPRQISKEGVNRTLADPTLGVTTYCFLFFNKNKHQKVREDCKQLLLVTTAQTHSKADIKEKDQ